ncbi:MAG: hypothetical protein ACI91F_002410 [Candidatus Binatia bacterium]|jgi:hypothetical protein
MRIFSPNGLDGADSALGSRRWVVILLALFASLICCMRLYTYDEPFERDLTTYAVIGHELNHGRLLYSDMWDNKPPGIFAAYAISESIVGYGPQTIFFLNIIASLGTLLALFFAGSHPKFGYIGGLFAAGLWVVIGGDFLLQANQPNTEAIINTLVMIGVALILRAPARWSLTSYLGIGLIFGVGGLFKQVCLVFALMVGFWHFIRVWHDTKIFRRAFIQMVFIGVGSALPWALTFLYFTGTDRFDILFASAIEYSSSYAGSMSRNILRAFGGGILWPSFIDNIKPLIISSFIFIFLGLIRTPTLWLLPLVLGASAFIVMALPGRFFPHYYQYYLPVICLVTGWGCSYINGLTVKLRIPAFLILGAILVTVTTSEMSYFKLSPDQISELKYGAVFTEVKNHSSEMRSLVNPDDFILDFGIETGFYFYTNTRPSAGVLWSNAITSGPLSREFTERFYRQVAENPPKLILIEDFHKGPPHEVVRWLYKSNQLLGRKGQFEYYAPEDSAVAAAAKGFFPL